MRLRHAAGSRSPWPARTCVASRSSTSSPSVVPWLGTTASAGRLYALPNTVPPKPGLVRVGAGDEQLLIELDVWALPPDGFGTFVASIPAPLCIGTVQLADSFRHLGVPVRTRCARQRDRHHVVWRLAGLPDGI